LEPVIKNTPAAFFPNVPHDVNYRTIEGPSFISWNPT